MLPRGWSHLCAAWSLCLPVLQGSSPSYDLVLTVAHEGFEGTMCWVHARAGAIPQAGASPIVVMTMQRLLLSGSDVFSALNSTLTHNGGATWSPPKEHESFARRPFAFRDQKDLAITVCDYWPSWHKKTGLLLGIGHTAIYEKNAVLKVRPRSTA